MRPTPPAVNDRSALLVVDIQRGGAAPTEESGIGVMDGYGKWLRPPSALSSAARAAVVPVIFIQELHRPSGVDFGRELDGEEGIHCVEGAPGTELWPTLRPGAGDYYVPKRRYSAFFGTDLDILLKGLGVDTVILIGSLTDVCVHYTFVDAHQRDFRQGDRGLCDRFDRRATSGCPRRHGVPAIRRPAQDRRVLAALGARALTPPELEASVDAYRSLAPTRRAAGLRRDSAAVMASACGSLVAAQGSSSPSSPTGAQGLGRRRSRPPTPPATR